MNSKRTIILLVVFLILISTGVGMTVLLFRQQVSDTGVSTTIEQGIGLTTTQESAVSGDVIIRPIIEGLSHPWDIKLSPDGVMYFTQRGSGLYSYSDSVSEVYLPEDLYAVGEGGMLGFDLAPDFASSREVYVCFNSDIADENPQIVVSKLVLNESFSALESRSDIVTSIPSAQSGRHSGCRVRFDKNDENVIWIATGDSADGSVPQDPQSLGGKMLRIDRQGNGIAGNLEPPFDSRIFSYGHRNIQGITLFDEYHEVFGYGLTAEHGPSVNDEINSLIPGNFGWDPNLPYDESVPMTDTNAFPDAIEAIWASGDRTIAMCGIEYIEQGPWEGDILLAALKDSYILRFDARDDGTISKAEMVVSDYGRIRQVYQAENGRIFFSTDNGNDDIIGEIVFD